jgi:hypothetical protein
MLASVELNMGRKPDQASADAGYCSEANLQAMADRAIDAYIAPGRAKHATANNGKTSGPLTQAMRKKIDDGGFDTPYRLRKQTSNRCSARSSGRAGSASSCCAGWRKCAPEGR